MAFDFPKFMISGTFYKRYIALRCRQNAATTNIKFHTYFTCHSLVNAAWQPWAPCFPWLSETTFSPFNLIIFILSFPCLTVDSSLRLTDVIKYFNIDILRDLLVVKMPKWENIYPNGTALNLAEISFNTTDREYVVNCLITIKTVPIFKRFCH